MSQTVEKAGRLTLEPPAAFSPHVLPDRKQLALVAVERTRMPMVVTDPRQRDNPIALANRAFLELSGYSAGEVVGRNCRFLQGPGTDPADVAKVRQAIEAEREVTVQLLNYRKDGSSFWNELFLSPVQDEEGRLLYFFGSAKDISKRRQAQDLEAEEYRLLREVDHRAKNALALVQGIVRLSRSDDAKNYARQVQSRVDALARAHSILAAQRWRDVPLDRLIVSEAEPFGTKRISFQGPPVEIGPGQVQPLGLILHEMLANAAQHGALSSPGGTVTIRWRTEGEAKLVLDWTEGGGPPPPEERTSGFGSAIINATVSRQLDGRATFDWKPTGLESRFELPLSNGSDAREEAHSEG